LFLFGSFTKKITVKIVTLTLNPALDKSTTTLRLIPEQKLRCTGMKTDAGGGGINVSVNSEENRLPYSLPGESTEHYSPIFLAEKE
jgi:hypothetical protein